LEIDFKPIAAYDALPADAAYKVFPGQPATATTPGDPVDCTGLVWVANGTPATSSAGITCALVTNFRISLTIGATVGAIIGGEIKGMQNPFSVDPLTINSISYKSAQGGGCSK
jgi:hypothetical protein